MSAPRTWWRYGYARWRSIASHDAARSSGALTAATAASLGIDTQSATLLLGIAEDVAAQALANGALPDCAPGEDVCVEVGLRSLAVRVYRRPATDAELEALRDFIVAAEQAGDGSDVGFRNAVMAIARASVLLSDMTSEADGITVNIGRIEGGGAVNVVPDFCQCRFNIRVDTTEQMTRLEANMADILQQVGADTGCALSLHGGFNRPPKPMTPAQQSLFELLRECGQELGLDIQWRATGGCCEGNNLASVVETLENLPAEGKPNVVVAHTEKGAGISFIQGRPEWHHRVPKGDEVEQALEELRDA